MLMLPVMLRIHNVRGQFQMSRTPCHFAIGTTNRSTVQARATATMRQSMRCPAAWPQALIAAKANELPSIKRYVVRAETDVVPTGSESFIGSIVRTSNLWQFIV
jgi:hypothetical protein